MTGGPDDDVEPTRNELLILKLLGHSELYALDLVKASGGRLKRGSIYMILGRAEQRGLVSSRPERETPPHIGIPRRLYRSTKLGRLLRDAASDRNFEAFLEKSAREQAATDRAFGSIIAVILGGALALALIMLVGLLVERCSP